MHHRLAPFTRRLAPVAAVLLLLSIGTFLMLELLPGNIVDSLIGGTGVKAGVLDPEGADLAPGPDAYFTLMDRIADSLVGCLKPEA